MVTMEKEEYWSRFAENFEEGSRYVIGSADLEIVLKKLAEQKDLKKTLELGCGCGMYSGVLAREASELYATDWSEEMLDAARNRLKGFPTITIEKENCFQLSYPDGMFETVFIANLLHVVPEPEKAVAEAKRVLRTGGALIVISYTTEGMKLPDKLGMIYRYLKTWGKPPRSARTLRLADAADILTTQGFEVEQSHLLGNRSKAIFIKAIRGEG